MAGGRTPACRQARLDYQKQERLRELLRDLEGTVVNGAAPAGDLPAGRQAGEVIGEYTLEFRNENAHGMIKGLDVS